MNYVIATKVTRNIRVFLKRLDLQYAAGAAEPGVTVSAKLQASSMIRFQVSLQQLTQSDYLACKIEKSIKGHGWSTENCNYRGHMKIDLFLLFIWLNNTGTREFKIHFNINENTRDVWFYVAFLRGYYSQWLRRHGEKEWQKRCIFYWIITHFNV